MIVTNEPSRMIALYAQSFVVPSVLVFDVVLSSSLELTNERGAETKVIFQLSLR